MCIYSATWVNIFASSLNLPSCSWKGSENHFNVYTRSVTKCHMSFQVALNFFANESDNF